MSGTQVEGRNGLSFLLLKIRDKALLTRDEERGLAKRAREGKQDGVDGLVESNLAFVVKVAKEYRDCGLPFEDLFSEGCVGLIEAAKRYDAGRDCKFVTYATWWIRKEILSAVIGQSSVIRVPNYHRHQVRKVRGVERRLERALGRRPRPDELSAHLSMSAERINRFRQWSLRTLALDEKVGKQGDLPVHEVIADDGAGSPEQEIIRSQSQVLVREALAELTPQEQTVLTHRFGLEDKPLLTLNELGRILGLSRERIRQIENQGKKRLRRIVIRKRHPVKRLERPGDSSPVNPPAWSPPPALSSNVLAARTGAEQA